MDMVKSVDRVIPCLDLVLPVGVLRVRAEWVVRSC